MSALLELRGVRAGYGALPVLDGVDLRIAAGEAVALVGRNGSGRSTLAKAIMGMVRVEGTVRIGGVDVAGAPTFAIARHRVGYVDEHRDVFALLSVEDNLRLGLRGASGAAARERYPMLAERWRTKAGVLSGGEQQMLALARALIGAPRVLIVDEPAEGLAPLAVEQVRACLAGAKAQGVALLLIEQRMQLAPALTSRVAVMGRGRIVYDGAAKALDAGIVERWLSVG
ncbi:ABC transporter ATP-binding protein [Burkholderia pseudomallei]|uniref:ABC transporter ATP-binding protein n=1 Tax=Burkholderia pseudomallei TaxID=28450 RepID=UPI001A9D7B06|nr:ABC transporter ATP-binding protein [Burkholderia pseudomallei]MBO7929107.1 ABC transporter ATP-binding protein [Burkholderia pseudomallei]QTB35578.1 ABC transporter ATP-binding protein [Burkholderia pseudomallei]QWJ94139.1 ABC transporter ATP-binding protein [Burkholderia pseudomallei]